MISGSRKECVSDVRHIKEAIWIRHHAPNTMNRDEGAHYLSHVYVSLLATPTSGDRRNRRGDQVPSTWWSVLTRTHETVNTSKFFILVLTNELLIIRIRLVSWICVWLSLMLWFDINKCFSLYPIMHFRGGGGVGSYYGSSLIFTCKCPHDNGANKLVSEGDGTYPVE